MLITSSATNEQQKVNEFTRSKSNIALISEESSFLIDGLKNELKKIVNFVDLPDNAEALQDALFFRNVTYILRIPQGFTQGFINGEDVALEKTIIPNSISNVYVDLSIDKYLNTARLYIKTMDNISEEKLVEMLKADLAKGAGTEVLKSESKPQNHIYANFFFNYLAYSLLSILILGMSSMMISFNNNDLKRRVGCSPLSNTNIGLQFILGNLTFALVAWLIMIVFCIMVDYKNSMNLNTVYFIMNSFGFAICGTSLGFFIGTVAKGEAAISAITNVVVLGSCFISGVFVPAELLSDTVLNIASFSPTYWYVRANNQIAQLTKFDFTHLQPVFTNMLIVFCFALAFFAVAMVIRKSRKYS